MDRNMHGIDWCAKSGLAVGVALCAILLVLDAVRTRIRRWQHDVANDAYLMSCLSSRFVVRCNKGIREMVQKHLDLAAYGVRSAHPHPTAAKNRNTANAAMKNVVSVMGLEPYYISPSLRDIGDGYRAYYQPTDIAMDPKCDPITNRHVLIMTDVDYYANMAMWISYRRPILLYTMVPETAGGDAEDGFFSFTDDKIVYEVSGGERYEHMLWDYSRATLAVPEYVPDAGCPHNAFLSDDGLLSASLRLLKWFMVQFLTFVTFDVIMCNVDHFRVSRHRRIISIVPFARSPVGFFLDKYLLRRARITITGENGVKYNIIRNVDGITRSVSVTRCGMTSSVTVPEKTFNAVRVQHQYSTMKQLSETWRRVKDDTDDDGATLLHDYLKNTSSGPMFTAFNPGEPAVHFNCVGTDKFPGFKTYARRMAPGPLTEEAVYPLKTTDNEEQCILGRLKQPQQKANAGVYEVAYTKSRVSNFMAEYAREFVRLVVPHAGIGHPMTVDEVVNIQDKPRQRGRSLQAACIAVQRFVVSAFIKSEAYNTPNDPRNISTVPTTHTLKLSCFTLAFKELLKRTTWYAPGRTPREIAAMIQRIASTSDKLAEGDFSRFDGHVTQWLRVHIEQAAYLRWVSAKHHSELAQLLNDEINPRAYTATGIRYDPGCSRLSGSPLTTDSNTLMNAFVFYAAGRFQGLEPDWLFQNMGAFYGDDAVVHGRLVADQANVSSLLRTVEQLGMSLKLVLHNRGQPVGFLSRYFVDPWTTPDSMADPLRALLKIHTTVNTELPVNECLALKTRAYLVTDPNTPFISDWCRAVLRVIGDVKVGDHHLEDVPYWSCDDESVRNPWPQETISGRADIIADQLGTSLVDVNNHIALLQQYAGPLSGLPRFVVPAIDVKIECEVDGIHRVPGDMQRDIATKTVENGGQSKEGNGRGNYDTPRSRRGVSGVGTKTSANGRAGARDTRSPRCFVGDRHSVATNRDTGVCAASVSNVKGDAAAKPTRVQAGTGSHGDRPDPGRPGRVSPVSRRKRRPRQRDGDQRGGRRDQHAGAGGPAGEPPTVAAAATQAPSGRA